MYYNIFAGKRIHRKVVLEINIGLFNGNTVETVCLLSNRKSKPDTHVDLTLDMEDYYRIKD